MQVKCAICGKVEQIDKLNKNYKKMEANPSAIYICEVCNQKLSYQAARQNDLLKKI